MDQSFNPAELTLEKAAELVAVRAQLGACKPAADMTKAAIDWTSTPNMAMMGAGVGLGGGLLATIMSKRKKKRWLRNALMGATLGGGLGAAGGAIANMKAPTDTPLNKNVADYHYRLGRVQLSADGQPDPLTGLPFTDATTQKDIAETGRLSQVLGLQGSGQATQKHHNAGARQALFNDAFERGDVIDMGKQFGTYTFQDATNLNTLVRGAGMTGAGGAAGHFGIDKPIAKIRNWRAAKAHNARMDAPMGPAEARDVLLEEGSQSVIDKKLREQWVKKAPLPAKTTTGPRFTMPNKMPLGGKSFTVPQWVPKVGGKTVTVPQNIPWVGGKEFGGTKTITHPRTGKHDMFKGEKLTEPQMKLLQEQVTQSRKRNTPAPVPHTPGKAGKRTGSVLGLIGSTLTQWGRPNPSPAQGIQSLNGTPPGGGP